jgi:hypothetical protein
VHRLDVIFCCRALIRGHEVDDKLPAQVLPQGDGLRLEVHELSSCHVLEGHREPVIHDALISTSGLDGDDVELEELDGNGGSIVANADEGLTRQLP